MEIVSFLLIVGHNNYQKTVFFRQTYTLLNSVASSTNSWRSYFNLKEENEKLSQQNVELKNEIEKLKIYAQLAHPDSLTVDGNFVYRPARNVNANFNKTKNYITLNKGLVDGINREMAVCSKDGVIGVVQNVNRHNAIVLPLINVSLRVSAKVKKNGYYGSLQWDGSDYRYSYLNDIPFHVSVEQGDTIVTSGFSSIFPEGELIGFVETVDRETANFLSIKVKLAADFRKISDVYVIEDKYKGEKKQLEATDYEEEKNN